MYRRDYKANMQAACGWRNECRMKCLDDRTESFDCDRGCDHLSMLTGKVDTWTSRAVGGACWRISYTTTEKMSARLCKALQKCGLLCDLQMCYIVYVAP